MSVSNILIRNVSISDAEALLKIYAYYVKHTAISFEYDVPTLEEFSNRILNITAKYPYLVAECDGDIVGYACAHKFIDRAAYDHSVETTIYIAENLKNHGIGGKLYQKLEEELKVIGIINLYACVAYPEVEDEYLTMNSVNFHQHFGYEICGRFQKCGYKFNRWYDMVWMEKLIGHHE